MMCTGADDMGLEGHIKKYSKSAAVKEVVLFHGWMKSAEVTSQGGTKGISMPTFLSSLSLISCQEFPLTKPN